MEYGYEEVCHAAIVSLKCFSTFPNKRPGMFIHFCGIPGLSLPRPYLDPPYLRPTSPNTIFGSCRTSPLSL